MDEQARAGIEGALEGSGLLDAWVMPDGTVVDEDDAVLVAPAGHRPARPPAEGQPRSLGPWSRSRTPRCPDEVVEAVLARIALDDELSVDLDPRAQDGRPAGGQRAACVALDGGFALGPLRGPPSRRAARYIGVAARAANRARRLAELARELAGLDEREPALEGEADSARAGVWRGCARRFAGCPTIVSAVRALVQLDRARAEEQRAAADRRRARSDDARSEELASRARGARSVTRASTALPAPERRGGAQRCATRSPPTAHACGELIGGERLRRERDAHQPTTHAAHAHRARTSRSRARGGGRKMP